ncbi:hypothetical protein AQUCO_03900048v1 [Aquilegia coerulea]|uniref:Uncharacterized protein n=1 Tax=Aquilegia coerulea TaxID=218851 RepID=A0A2G5CRK0_AQUCA|nr:hypothetical protein AQUCO_03900048v1 [Aquilegia coerulea]
MGSTIGGGGNGLWWKFLLNKHKHNGSQRKSQSSDSIHSNNGGSKFNFPLKQALTAASLTLTGDTIAQLSSRWKTIQPSSDKKDVMETLLSNHDWLRSLRMASYGFLLYGPGSYAWYQYLDHALPKPTVENFLLKVVLNQVVLGPCVIGIVFAWNNLWKGKLAQLPAMYQNDALPTLLYGLRFWVPASILNFWVIPLQARVAFMSTCSIFWNFYLSSTMSNAILELGNQEFL